MQIRYDGKFVKMYAKTPTKIKQAFKNRQTVFLKDQYHHSLNNHELSGKYKDCRSINITGDWRAIFKEKDGVIYFRLLGRHSQLYK
ncbi:MAG: type II toxin-antitoxin system mRNA interferase toxin, RelE/StbE family [Patescibacteria group bacterium]